MKSAILLPCLASLLAFGGCGDKKSSKDKATAADQKGQSAAAGSAARDEGPLDTSKSDALWALAPQGAVLGLVAMPGAGSQLHAMSQELLRVFGARPLGAKLLLKMHEEAADLPFNILDAESTPTFPMSGFH